MRNAPSQESSRAVSGGSVLVGLLWCVALLAVIVVGALYRTRLDLLVVKNHGDRIQAHYLAVAGIEKAKALLYHDAKDRKRSANNHSGALYDSPSDFKEVPFGRGQFSVFRQGTRDEGGGIVYGISDEEGLLNFNEASAEEMGKLLGMTPEIAAAIVDYRDQDSQVTPGGAESESYAALQPRYLPRDGPFESTRELLMVYGMPRELLLGEDANQNGILDPDENDGNDSYPSDNHDGFLDGGWSGLATVASGIQDMDAAGEARVNIQSADETALGAIPGMEAGIAKAIVAYRGQNEFKSLVDLLNVRALVSQGQRAVPQNQNQGGTEGAARRANINQRGQGNSPQAAPRTTGPELVSEELLMEIADHLTVGSNENRGGPINVNTASAEVLACVPGITREISLAIVSYRRSAGFLPNVAHLLRVPGMTRDILKESAPRLCARSETFRILSEGKVLSTGARKRIQEIVRVGPSSVDTLAYREDL